MIPQRYQAVKEQVLGTLSELGLINSIQLGRVTRTLEDKESISIDSARVYLLSLVTYSAGVCTACERYEQRVNPCVSEGALDSPFIVYDYPTYADTMSGRPLAGMPEVLLSKCGSCTRLEEHFTPALKSINNEELVPFKGDCNYARYSDGNSIVLPVVFQAAGRVIKPLISPGQVLDRLLVDIGERRDGWAGGSTVYITSSLLCPSVADNGLNKPVKVGDRKACAPWLTLQIAVVDPTFIICMGSEAMNRFYTDKTTVTEEVGKYKNVNGRMVGVTWHPSLVLRNKDGIYYDEIKKHLALFFDKSREVI